MLPGMGNIKALAENKPDEKQMARVEAIINSMTPDERRKQHIINGSRRKRIAKGSGTSVEEVNRLLKQFVQMQKMLKSLGGMARHVQAAAKKRAAARWRYCERVADCALERTKEQVNVSDSSYAGRARRSVPSSVSW